MAQTNPFDQFDTASAPLPSPPKPAPDREPKTTWRPMTPEEVKQNRLPADKPYQISSEGKIDSPPTSDTKATVDQQKIATLLTRIAGGFHDVQSITATNPAAQEPGLVETWRGGLSPDGFSGPIVRSMAGSDRRSVYDSQVDVLDALLTLGTGAAYNKEQLTGQTTAYFPQYGDSDQEKKIKNQRMLRLIEAAKQNAGPAWDKVEPAIAPYMQSLAASDKKEEAPPVVPGGGGGLDMGGGSDGPPPGQVLLGYYRNQDGSSAPIYGAPGSKLPDGAAPPTPAEKAAEDHRIAVEAGVKSDQEHMGSMGKPGTMDILKNGLTGSLYDEASGVGGAIGAFVTGKDPVAAYEMERDKQRLRLEEARQKGGWIGTGAELLSGAAGMGVSGMGQSTARSIGSLAREGAGVGALYGFGNGEGVQQSLTGAATGGVMGGAIGAGAGKLSDLLATRAANRPVDPLAIKASELAQAGADEGVTINRAMVDPALQNRVSGVDASVVGGPRVQAGMNEIEGQIASRVSDLGGNGKAMDRLQAGDLYQGASERYIKNSGIKAGRLYNKAETLAGDARVTPTESLSRVNDMITKLSETPTTNAKEISFLQGIQSDLSKDLSVSGLRAMRTKLRKQISSGDLVFGQDEARVLSIMDGAADDIRAGLIAQGKGDAAKAFDAADNAYRERMDYIQNTLQKVIGKRNANFPSENIADRVASMARGKDAVGLKKFYATLTPDEQANVAATFAEQIGKNGKDGFSIPHFLTQTAPNKFSDSALQTIFGPRGAASIRNLRTIGAEVARVTSAMNSRTSKTAVANDYRSILFNTLFSGAGGGLLGATGGAPTTGALLAAGATLGVKAGRDILGARALLSPDLTKWIMAAPRNASPAAIRSHIAQLSNVAAQNAGIAADARGLQQYLLRSLEQSPTRAAAQQEDDGRRKPVQ